MTSAHSPTHILLASVLSAAACDRSEDAAATPTPRESETPSVKESVPQDATPPATEGPRDAPAGQWSVQTHHPRLHQLDDEAWAEFTLEFLSGVVETKDEADGLRLLSIGTGSVVGQVGFLPGDLLLALGSARPPSRASLHDAWALGKRTHWVEVERQRGDSNVTLILWMPRRAKTRNVASALARLGVVRQDNGRRLIDRALLEALAETQWLYRHDELWQSLGVPSGGPVLRVDDSNVGQDGQEFALKLIAERADQRTFKVVVGTDDGEVRLQYEVVEGLLDPEALAQIRASPKPASVPRRVPAESPTATTFEGAVEKKGEHHYSVDRARFDELLADPGALARSARMVPNYTDGKPVGFKMFGIRPSSFLSELGFHNGDLLLSVQGRDLAGMADALEAYAEFSKSAPKTIRVGIIRRGTELELKFDLE